MNPEILLKLAKYKMPFGKYLDCPLINLPEQYLIWFREKGLPKGELGEMLALTYEIKLNGLEYLVKKLM